MLDLLDRLKRGFVLTSPNGCSHESGVVRQAFLLVQQRLLDEKVDVAVLVLLDLLFPKFKYLQMRKRLCKKSVLSWPKNPRVQPLFWNNLRVALVSDNVKAYNKNVTESFF
uniref:Toll-like receptor 9 n=1 Tax=Cyprinus carpio TaxID=7962 RepID=G1ERW3_CYPCA|nr:Toll-like receptor 9 [Cyprinus carpio]